MGISYNENNVAEHSGDPRPQGQPNALVFTIMLA
jgi:hypothetical protein